MNITSFVVDPDIVKKASQLDLTCKPWSLELMADCIDKQMDHFSTHIVRVDHISHTSTTFSPSYTSSLYFNLSFWAWNALPEIKTSGQVILKCLGTCG
jgi:hypothetical protein